MLELEKESESAVSTALKNYIIIRLISTIETSCKRIIRDEIDRNKINVKNFFYKKDILLRISDLDSIKDVEFTKGAIVASNFNMQNLVDLDEVLSNITGVNFFETLLELLKIPNDPKINFDEEALTERFEFVAYWDKFKEIFETRNKIIHRNDDVKMNVDELRKLIEMVVNFICYIAFFVQIFYEIKTNNLRDELNSDVTTVLGNTGDTVVSIIKKKSNKKRSMFL